MKPSYIQQINLFHAWLETHYLSPYAQLLWFKLINLHNKCGWSEWVQVDTVRLMGMIGVDSNKVAYRARDALVSSGLIDHQKGKKGCPSRYRMNYFLCQFDTENDTENDTNSEQKKTRTNLQSDKKINKEAEIPSELSEAWDAFVEMRKKIKKPLTKRAETMIWNKLREMAKDNPVKQAEILNQSTMHCWQTVYPLKEEEQPASYDIDEMEKKLLYGEIKYERKEVV